MNLTELQAELRCFAAERDWQPFHTPKNLSTALMVEAAELAEIFQWMTPEQSQEAWREAEAKQRIGEEVADVLLYLLQLADHCRIDVAEAAARKLASNALKYPAKRSVARVSAPHAATSSTHVLLDYENVQPTEDELRAMVPEAGQVWVFHGPHQKLVEQRFAGYGANVTAVPISKTGKNALDFHLSFYMGYIASRNPAASLVVVANDKGYEPMLEHARAMGFPVHQEGHQRAKPKITPKPASASKTGLPSGAVAKKAAAKKAAAKPSPTKKPAPKEPMDGLSGTAKAPARKAAPAKKAASTKKATSARSAKASAPPTAAAVPAAPAPAPAKKIAPAKKTRAAKTPPEAAPAIQRLIDSLRKMGDKRPTKPASLLRALKSFLGLGATESATQAALASLAAAGVVRVDAGKGVSYPLFAS